MAKKHLAAAAAAVTVGLVLAGCSSGGGGGSQSDEPTGEITVLTNRTDLIESGKFDEYKADFEELYPDVTITFEGITDYEGEVTTRLSTTEYGDVLAIPASVTPEQRPQFFEPLGDTEELKEQYRFLDGATFEGQQYGLPTFGNANGIVYNKRIWEEAGVTELPTTPEEFLADLQLIADNTDAIPYYTNYKDGWPLGSWQGQQGFSNDPNIVETRTGNDAPWTEGEEQYIVDSLLYDIVEAGLSEPDPLTTEWEGSKGLLASGEAATAVLGSWAIIQFQEAAEAAGVPREEIGFMPFPYQVDGAFHSGVGGDNSLAINKNSDAKAAARAWIDWFINESDFSEVAGGLPSQVDGENPPTLADFTEAGVEYVELEPAEDLSLDSDIYNEAEIDLFGNIYRQKLVDIARGAADGDKESYFEELNTRWAEARAEVTS